ncbi:MAG: chloride channel protein [Marinobacter sp.]
MDRRGIQQIVYQISMVTAVAIIVGAAASLAAIGFVDAVHYLNDRLLSSPYARIQAEYGARLVSVATVMVPAAGGLVVGLVALWIPEVLGIGQETLRFATIEGAFGIGELALIIVAKLILTALLIGILFGAFYGLVLPYVAPVPHSGLVVYAICGMMALASSVIGAPLTTILIVFELTRSYDLTIAAMVSVVFANLISYRVIGRSLFDLQLRDRGFDLSLGRDKAILETHRITDYVSRQFSKASNLQTVGDVRQQMVDDHRSEAMVLDHKGVLVGVVRLQGICQ